MNWVTAEVGRVKLKLITMDNKGSDFRDTVADFIRANYMTLVNNNIDYQIHHLDVLELSVNGSYFCSVAPYDDGTFEIYETQHGAKFDEMGTLIKEGELWQYRVYKSLKVTLKNVLQMAIKGKLPRKPLRKW